MERNGKAYLGRVNTLWSTWRPRTRLVRLNRLTFKPRMLGEPWHEDRRPEIECISVNQAGEDEITYHGHVQLVQPPPNGSKRLHGVHIPRRQCGRIKNVPINVNRMELNGNAYLQCVNALPSTRRPKKNKRRISNLTFEYRMQGESWRNVEDHG